MSTLFTYPKFHAQTNTGAALSGGKLYTYAPGTTTPKASYSDINLATPNTNPVILNSSGDAVIYLSGTYDVVLKNSAGVTQWSMSGVSGVSGASSAYSTVMTGDGVIPYSSTVVVCFADGNGAERNLVPDSTFPVGSIIIITNVGAYALVFDPSGLNVAVGGGSTQMFLASLVGANIVWVSSSF